MWLSHKKKDQLKKKTHQDHKPGSNTASAFSSPGNPFPLQRGGGFFCYLCFQVNSPSAGRLLPGLRAPFTSPPPVKSTFTAGGTFKTKKKTGKPKPRLLCQCDNCKSVTLDLLMNPFPCVWWIIWHACIQTEWAGVAISRWASSHPRVGV